jgi:hypothetical protein
MRGLDPRIPRDLRILNDRPGDGYRAPVATVSGGDPRHIDAPPRTVPAGADEPFDGGGVRYLITIRPSTWVRTVLIFSR